MNVAWPERIAGLLVGMFLVVTSIPHILAPFRFPESLLAYRLVFGWLAELTASVLPWFQLVTGFTLVLKRRHDAGWLAAGLLFGLYLGVQASAIFRGLQIDCGCFPGRTSKVSINNCLFLMGLVIVSMAGLKTSMSNRPRSSKPPLNQPNRYGDCSVVARSKSGTTGGYRKGWSLIEVIAVFGITGTLVAFFLPAVQRIRESARQVSCINQLRQMGLACLNYESARRKLPAGTLGFPGSVIFDSWDGIEWSDSASPGHWQHVQHTSALVQLLPHMGGSSTWDDIPRIVMDENSTWKDFRRRDPSAPEWIGELPFVQQASRVHIPSFMCPSDSIENADASGALAFVATQPAFFSGTYSDWFLTENPVNELVQPAGTNYIANSGAHGAGRDQSFVPAGFAGPFLSRPGTSLSINQDGLSNTVLFGECIGAIENRTRTGYHAWMFGGLARGRGALPWMRDINLLMPQYLLFGDDQWSHPSAFGSMHPEVVNFVFADGSTHSVSRTVNLPVFYGLCGSEDGFQAEN